MGKLRNTKLFICIHSCSLIEHAMKTEEELLRENTCIPGKTSAVFENLHKNETFVKILKHCVFLRSAV